MKVNSILETIGNTPHVKINRLFDPRFSVWVKLEKANPGASIKDRIALSMVVDAENFIRQSSLPPWFRWSLHQPELNCL